jgi:hypothetical protein
MRERRQRSRNRVYYGGLLAFNARTSSLACVVRDYNEFGAKIELDGAEILPEHVDFVVERKQLSCSARLVWRNDQAAGLQFCNPAGVIPLEWARKLQASNRANKQLRLRIEQLQSERRRKRILIGTSRHFNEYV